MVITHADGPRFTTYRRVASTSWNTFDRCVIHVASSITQSRTNCCCPYTYFIIVPCIPTHNIYKNMHSIEHLWHYGDTYCLSPLYTNWRIRRTWLSYILLLVDRTGRKRKLVRIFNPVYRLVFLE